MWYDAKETTLHQTPNDIEHYNYRKKTQKTQKTHLQAPDLGQNKLLEKKFPFSYCSYR